MRRYETIFIADPDIPEESRVQLFDKVKSLIDEQGGQLVEFDNWGNKKLAYEIKKKLRGYYVRLDYCGVGKVVDELERFFRIDDRVLRFLTVLLDENADLESIENMKDEQEAEENDKEEKKEQNSDHDDNENSDDDKE
jgi:small subunit ribosomal protein S6